MKVEHQFHVVNGVRLHCAVAGTGPLLLLLHGFPESWYSWRYQLAELSQHFQVVAPDMRGFNESEQPPRIADYATDKLVDDVVGLIQAFGAERAAVAGHDWGGLVAWQVALRRPDVVDKLIILNAPHPHVFLQHLVTNPSQMLRSQYVLFFQLPWLPEALFSARDYRALEELFAKGTIHREHFGPEVIAKLKAAARRGNRLRGGLNYYRAAARETLRMKAPPNPVVALPTLVIWGEQDRALGKELNDPLPRYVPDLHVRYIADSSHWVQQERPDLVSRYIADFLSTTG